MPHGWTPVAEPHGWTRVEDVKPQAGMSTADIQAANLKNRDDLPSTSGFLGNAVTSAGGFLKDTAMGAAGLGKLAWDASQGLHDEQVGAKQARAFFDTVKRTPEIASKLWQAGKDRYGGIDQALHTAYTDPVGVAADVSTVAGGVGLGAKAGRATRLAKAAGAVEKVANPMSTIGGLANAGLHGTANALVRTTLRPPAGVRAEFGGSKAIADAVLKDRVFSEANAQKKLTASVSQADKMLADAQAAGVAGVPRRPIANAVIGEPRATAKLRTRLGVPDTSSELMGTAKSILRNNPREIPLTEAQAMKREAQKLASEAGRDNLSVTQAAREATAGALKTGIEQRVPEVAPINARSQGLIGVQKSFDAAQDRPRALTNYLALLGGRGGAGVKLMDSPRIGAMTGIGINSIGQGLNAQSLHKAALLARLLGSQEPAQEP